MRKKIFLLILTICLSIQYLSAQDFGQYFEDSTLRIDYIFSGDAHKQSVSMSRLNVSPKWYGKRQRLDELPMEGNGQITVRDHRTGKVIYRNSFSTLFQEWLTFPEAQTTQRAFENVFLVPMPKDTVDITIDLRNNRRNIICSMSHSVVPTDILIRHIGEQSVMPHTTLRAASDPKKCIHIAILSEGYTQEEMPIFLKDCEIAVDAIFAHEPFKSYKSRFNVVAVQSPSAQSGTSEPGKGIWKDTNLGSHFDTFYSDRYLTTLNLMDMHDQLAGIPYEHIIVLVNTEKYGGGGILNSYNLSMTHNDQFRPVVVHEFGHSFGGLGDEYAYDSGNEDPMYPLDIEPWEKNITTLVNFENKWENLLSPKTPIPTPIAPETKNKIGVYEGAGYTLKGVYRPYPDCRMRTNEHPEFCPACLQALTNVIKFYTE